MPGAMAALADAEPLEWCVEGVAAERDVQVSLGDGDVELHAAVAPLDQARDQRAIEGDDVDVLRAVDLLAAQLPRDALRVLVRVHHDAFRELARLVQPRGGRR